ncbi:hypothetical protein [Streptomyces sp. 4F14]|uniref:hypothetical protein n=1 Tax=Streptomyces sp. 4F14 TaxID=3394380 RepID=UPI003A85BE57
MTTPLPHTSFDRILAITENLLFSLTRQAHRFGSCTDPRQQLAAYDTEFIPLLTEAGE